MDCSYTIDIYPRLEKKFEFIDDAIAYCEEHIDCDGPFLIKAQNVHGFWVPAKDILWNGKWMRRASYGNWQDV